MGKWIIEDWMGNRIFRDHAFSSFENGWDFIYENIKEEQMEEDGLYDDYYVAEI